MEVNKGREIVLYIITILLLFIVGIQSYYLFQYKELLEEEKNKEDNRYVSNYCMTDDEGYGTVAIGTSEVYVLQDTCDLYDNPGYTSNDSGEHYGSTNWSMAIIADDVTNTEYLIFKDKETGNIAAVERRKYEEDIPEKDRSYLPED